LTVTLVLLLVTLLLVPILFFPLRFIDGYILPPIGIATIGLSLTSIFFVYNGIFPCNLSIILALLYFVYLMISNSWASVPHNALREVPLIFSSVIIFILGSVLMIDYNNIVIISFIVFITSMLTCIYGISQKFCYDPIFPERLKIQGNKDGEHYKDVGGKFLDSRAISTLGNTNFAAGYFCSTLPFLLFLTFYVSKWFALSLIIFFAGVRATRSRAGMLSIIVSSIFFLLFISKQGLIFDNLIYLFADMRIELILILIVIVISVGAHLLIKVRVDKWNPLKGLSEDNHVNNFLDISNTHQDHFVAHLRFRFRYWHAAWDLISRRPLQGYGLRSYRKEVYDAQSRLNFKDPEFLGDDYQTPQPRECHNDFIENFVEGGIVGGSLFLLILGVVFYNVYNYTGENYIVVAGVSSGIIGVLVNAFFFFPLRLASSATAFWLSLGMMESITGNVKLIAISINIIVVIILAGILMAMIWEGVIKPNLGNFYFMLYNYSKLPHNRENYLWKSIECCPKESIFRTHLVLNYMHTRPNLADQMAEALRQHYDGMVPAWTMTFNSGAVKAINRCWEDSLRFFNDSLKYLPSFAPSVEFFRKVFPFSPLPRGRILMKQITEEGKMTIKSCQSELVAMKTTMGNIELMMINSIITEARKMNIPMEWIFDFNTNSFLTPQEASGRRVIEFGPNKLLAIMPEGQPQPTQIGGK